MNYKKSNFNTRGFTSILLFLFFIIVAISGMVLVFIPHGRDAYWINWTLLYLSKEQWERIHTMSGNLFIITSLLHLSFNWVIFKNYIISGVNKVINLKKEISLAVLISMVVLVIAIFEFQPAKQIFRLTNIIKESWVSDNQKPPFPHAELLTISKLAKKLNVSSDNIYNILISKKIIFDTNDSLYDIAKKNKTSPLYLYGVITNNIRKNTKKTHNTN